MSFSKLNLLPELLSAVAKAGYKSPTPIQEKVIPEILNNRDVVAAAQTGTGKTAGFVLPILQSLIKQHQVKQNQAQVLILTPTRELAAQVQGQIDTYAIDTKLKSLCVFGGVNINPQMQKLRGGVNILVATPGRLLDLMQRNAVKFPELSCLVLDEADRMLDMGFLPDIKRIIRQIPKQRQTLLFSATYSKEIKALTNTFLNNPVSISVSPQNSTANTVEQWFHPVDKKRKSALLSYLIGHEQWPQVLVFTRTKRGANKVAYDLQKSGIEAEAIHGNKSQSARNRVLGAFKSGALHVMVATDVAARGLDIDHLPYVVNLDLPNVAEDYVHRIGRTGRAGKTGCAVSLVSADEIEQLSKIEGLIKTRLKRIVVDGFDPKHAVPESNPRAPKKKKPHKRKIAKAQEKQGNKPTGNPGGKPNNRRSFKRRKSSAAKPTNRHNKT